MYHVCRNNAKQCLTHLFLSFTLFLRTSKKHTQLIFKKVHSMLGGRLRIMLSGGAPLSPETQEFMNIVFCLPIGQGYGATETCGAGTITHLHDVTVNTVGPPVACCHIRLVDVPEMGYCHTDRDERTGQV
jgi:long-chain acyl-CoA synthetase